MTKPNPAENPGNNPGTGAGKNPETPPGSAGWPGKLAELLSFALDHTDDISPLVRIYRCRDIGGAEPEMVDEMPAEELERAVMWLAEHHGPGFFRLDLMDGRGARVVKWCAVKCGTDRRQTRREPSRSSSSPAAAPEGLDADRIVDAVVARLEARHGGGGRSDRFDMVNEVKGILGAVAGFPGVGAAGAGAQFPPDVAERLVRLGISTTQELMGKATGGKPAAAAAEASPWWGEYTPGFIDLISTLGERGLGIAEKVVQQTIDSKRGKKQLQPKEDDQDDAADDDEGQGQGDDVDIVDERPPPAEASTSIDDQVKRAAAEAAAAAAEKKKPDDEEGGNGAPAVH